MSTPMDSLEEVRIGVAGGETDTATLDTTEPGKVESEEPVPASAALVEPTPIEAPSDLAGDDAVPVQTPAPSKSAPTIDETPSGAPAVDSSEVAAPLIPEASPRTEPTAMGPDYGNAEGVDISPPLPAAWSSVASLPPVVVYGEVLSPPSCKVRALLAFYGVPFTVSGKRRPGSTYAKRPHITIGTGAEMRQVNDSVVIFRTLGKPGRRSEVIFRHMRALLRTRPPCYAAGILSGAPVPAAAADLDRELSAEFPLAVEIECFTGMSSPEIDAYVRLDRECVGTHGGCLEVALARLSCHWHCQRQWRPQAVALAVAPCSVTIMARLSATTAPFSAPLSVGCLLSCVLCVYGRSHVRHLGETLRARPESRSIGSVTSCMAHFRAGFPDAASRFYHGASPGPLDVAVFGILFPFMEAGAVVLEVRAGNDHRRFLIQISAPDLCFISCAPLLLRDR